MVIDFGCIELRTGVPPSIIGWGELRVQSAQRGAEANSDGRECPTRY